MLGEPVPRFLAGLPDNGTLRLRLAATGQAELESRVSLQALAAVRQRLARSCGWATK